MSLIKNIQNLRVENRHVHPEIRNIIKRLRDADNDVSEPGSSRHPGTKGRCHFCRDSKTQYSYCKCKKYLCLKNIQILYAIIIYKLNFFVIILFYFCKTKY